MDLHDELEAAIGHGPALPDPSERVAAGRAALRRRRTAVAVGAAVAVAAIAVPVAVVAGGSSPGTGTAPATTTSSSPAPPSEASAEPEPRPSEPPTRWRRGELVRYLPDGTLEIRPGATVLDRVDDYLAGVRRFDRSVALELRFQGGVHWVTAEWSKDGSSGTGTTEANDGWADFRAYVADQAAANTGGEGGSGHPELVRVEEDGSLAAAPGTRILEQRADLGFPENFAPAGVPTAAAYVERDGQRYLVLYRLVHEDSELIPVPAAGRGDSLAELLDWARSRYESEEGVR